MSTAIRTRGLTLRKFGPGIGGNSSAAPRTSRFSSMAAPCPTRLGGGNFLVTIGPCGEQRAWPWHAPGLLAMFAAGVLAMACAMTTRG